MEVRIGACERRNRRQDRTWHSHVTRQYRTAQGRTRRGVVLRQTWTGTREEERASEPGSVRFPRIST
eukprot:2001906-Rhodomonas_salina.6